MLFRPVVRRVAVLAALFLMPHTLEASNPGHKELIGSVFFSSGSLDLGADAKREIGTIAAKIRELEETATRTGERLIIRLEGYTDSVGDDEMNLFISMLRAAVVEDYLVRVERVLTELYLTGFGESKARSPERSEDERRRNRRVDVVRIINGGDYLKVYRMERELPEIEKIVEEAEIEEEEPKEPKVLNRRGVELVRKNRFDEAVELFKRALEAEPAYTGARFNLAFAYQMMGRYGDAENEYKGVLESEDMTRAHLMLGIVYEKEGNNELAMAEFLEVLKREADNKTAREHLDRLTRLSREEAVKEVEVEEEAPEPEPDADDYNRKGASLIKEGRHDEALEVFEKALSIDPEHVGVTFNRAYVLQKMGRRDEALAEYERLVIKEEMPQAYFMLGVIYDEKGERRRAIGSFEKVLEMEPENARAIKRLERLKEAEAEEAKRNADAYNREGVALVMEGSYGKAVEIFDKALALNPGHVGAAFNRAFAFQKMGRLDEAEAGYERLLEMADMARARFMLGVIYEKRGENRKAIETFEQVLEKDPGNSRAKERIEKLKEEEKTAEDLIKEGSLHMEERRHERAVYYFGKAVLKSPDDFKTHFNLGLALLSMGRYDEAVEEFNKTLAINDLTRAHLMLGFTYMKRGDVESAMEEFRLVLEKEPDNELAKKYLER